MRDQFGKVVGKAKCKKIERAIKGQFVGNTEKLLQSVTGKSMLSPELLHMMDCIMQCSCTQDNNACVLA